MRKTKTIEIRNDFHNTSATARAKIFGQELHLSAGQVHRVRQELCGISWCLCGGHLGERGPQEQQYEIDPLRDGGVILRFVLGVSVHGGHERQGKAGREETGGRIVKSDRSMPPSRVKAIRAALGLTQAALARRLDVCLSTVRSWEYGLRPPSGPARLMLEMLERGELK